MEEQEFETHVSASELATRELNTFIDGWMAAKEKRITKTPRYSTVPDFRNRPTSLSWITQRLQQVNSIEEYLLVALYTYATNAIEELSPDSESIIALLAPFVDDVYVENYPSMLTGHFVYMLRQLLIEEANRYGSTSMSMAYLDALFAAFKDRNEIVYAKPGERRASEYPEDQYWMLYCVVIGGEPYIAIDKNLRPFKPGDDFQRMYEHYKRNPTYDFATYTIRDGRATHTIIFVIDGSPGVEIGRLFSTKGRRRCILLPTQRIVDLLQRKSTTAVPPEYVYLIQLAETNGTIKYIDEAVGRWKDTQRTYPFLELYIEILGVQKKLWEQSEENRELMAKTMSEIEQDALEKEKMKIEVYVNYDTPDDVIQNKIAYATLCHNINNTYENARYQQFRLKIHVMYYFVARPKDDPDGVLSFLFATRKNDGEVYIDLFCKNQRNRTTKAPRYLFPYALKYLGREYDYISLDAVPMAIPFYESVGFIRTPNKDDWVLPVQRGKRSVRRLYDPIEYRLLHPHD